jgi:hypothetical protein
VEALLQIDPRPLGRHLLVQLVLAMIGAGLTADGFFPLFHLPFLHGTH